MVRLHFWFGMGIGRVLDSILVGLDTELKGC
jgi:hypothetical protein